MAVQSGLTTEEEVSLSFLSPWFPLSLSSSSALSTLFFPLSCLFSLSFLRTVLDLCGTAQSSELQKNVADGYVSAQRSIEVWEDQLEKAGVLRNARAKRERRCGALTQFPVIFASTPKTFSMHKQAGHRGSTAIAWQAGRYLKGRRMCGEDYSRACGARIHSFLRCGLQPLRRDTWAGLSLSLSLSLALSLSRSLSLARLLPAPPPLPRAPSPSCPPACLPYTYPTPHTTQFL